jgi:tetratricopeptide (TPR) repeat protein
MMESFADALHGRATILIEQKKYAEAAAFLRQALAQDPQDGWGLYLLALCQLHMPAEEKAASATIDRALAADGNNAAFHALRSHILTNDKKYAAALSAADTAVAIGPDYAGGHIARCAALIGTERWKDAEASARAALALDPDNAGAGNLLSETLRFQNRGAETAAHVQSMLAKDPTDAFSHANAGWVALEKGDLKNAQLHFLEALRIDPGFEYARKGIVETFKAKSPVYRGYLAYSFAMAKIPPRTRLAIIIGAVIAVRLLRSLFTGDLWVIGALIGIAYMIFVLWSWVAGGVGNLILLTDRFARHALVKSEKQEAVLVGGGVMAGVLMLIAGFAASIDPLQKIGIACIAAAFPFSATFHNDHPTGRWVFGIAGAVVLACGVASGLISTIAGESGMATILFSATLIIGVLTTWMGAFGVLRR